MKKKQNKKHDDVLEKKGPLGENWRTNPQPFKRRVKTVSGGNQSKQQRIADAKNNARRLATDKSPVWEETEIFFRLCRGEQSRVLISSILANNVP